MRRIAHIRILCVVLLLLACQGAYAQSDNWNHVLDQYERICDQCIALRHKAEDGGLVQRQTISSLLEQLLSLRTRLQDASGVMTNAQKDRFVGIMRKYESAVSSSSRTSRERHAGQPRNSASAQSRLTGESEEVPALYETTASSASSQVMRPSLPPLERELLSGISVSDLSAILSSSSAALGNSVSPAEGPLVTNQREERHARFFVMGQFQFSNALMAGILAAYVPRKWGGYLSYRDNFRRVDRNEYSVSQDGHVFENKSGISVFWGSGKRQFHSISMTMGPVWRLNRYLMLYGGAGLGLRNLNWQDVDGSWARVVDFSDKGFAWETGVVGSYRRLSLGAGLSYYKDLDLVLSFGLNF